MKSSASHPASAERVLLAAGTETYISREFERLERVPESLRLVVEALSRLGFSTVVGQPGYLLDPGSEQLRDEIARLRDTDAPVVVLYYTGHGERPERDHYYVLTRESTHSPPRGLGRSAIPAIEFLELLTRRDEHGDLRGDQPAVLLILDCCYSGAGGMEALSNALNGIGNPRTWIVASAGPLDWAQQGRFASALSDALREPRTGPSQRYLGLETVMQAVNDAFRGEQEATWFPPAGGSKGLPPFFPNPDFRPSVAGLTLDEQHWRSRLQAGGTAASGFYVTGSTGRVRATEDLAAWLTRRDGGGLAVVIGSPGAGKSTLLALPASLAQPARRTELLRDAEPGSLLQRAADLLPSGMPLIAAHARGLNVDQVAEAVQQGLNGRSGSAAALLEGLALAGAPPSAALIVDAVDESTDPGGLIASLLLPLVRAGLRVLVGTRRHLLDAVRGAADLVIDLDAERYRDPDALTQYVYQLLVAAKEPDIRTPYQPTINAADITGGGGVDHEGDVAARVAAVIAQRATARDGGAESFLIARLLALSLRSRPTIVDISDRRWRTELPASVSAAFEEDLTRRIRDRVDIARVLLAALAWARGPGLPWETLWVPVARALAEDSVRVNHPDTISDQDARWLLRAAGSYIVEDLGAGGRSVFRPFHDLLAAHLRGEPPREQTEDNQASRTAWRDRRARIETMVTQALLATLPKDRSLRWPSAHPYLRTYLAEHAAAGQLETLPSLVRNLEFLAVADPVTLIPLLSVTDPRLRDAARVYRRAFPLLEEYPRANLAYLEEAAVALQVRIPGADSSGIRAIYRTRWASIRRDDSLLVLMGHIESVTSVAFGTGANGRPLLASASHDGTVRLWDPDTGALVGQPLTGLADGVTSVAFGVGADGRPLLASGDFQGTVRLWDPDSGAPVGEPLTGHAGGVTSVSFGVGADGRPLLASGDFQGTVRLWDPDSGAPVGEPLTGHAGGVTSVSFGVGADGRPLLATSGWDKTVRLWDPDSGAPVGQLLTGHTSSAGSVAFGPGARGRPLLAYGDAQGTVRLWDPGAGAPVGEPLTGHTSDVWSAAFGAGADGRPLLASGDLGGTVRLWDPGTGAPVGEPLTGHTNPVTSLAFGASADGRPLLASASMDGTVRLWDPTMNAPVGRPPARHTIDMRWVESVAFSPSVGGRPLLATAGYDSTVRLWDAGSGVPVGRPLTGHNSSVVSVAFGAGADGRPLLAAAGADGTVRLWDPGTGAPLGQPLTGHTEDHSPEASLAFGVGADGRPLLAFGGNDGVRLWDPDTGAPIGPTGKPLVQGGKKRQLRRPWIPRQIVTSVAFGARATGRPLLAAAGMDGAVRLWDPGTGSLARQPLTGHTASVRSVAFGAGADGRPLLASGGMDRTVRLWDPGTGAPVGQPLIGHTDYVVSVAFGTGADGRPLLASASPDGTVQLWDPTTGVRIVTLRRRSGVRCVAFADRALAIGDEEGATLVELDIDVLPSQGSPAPAQDARLSPS